MIFLRWINRIILGAAVYILMWSSFNAFVYGQLNQPPSSDNFSLKGKVVNITGKPIGGVRITLESDKFLYKISTDENGNYKFIVADGVYKLYTDPVIVSLDYDDKFYMPSKCSSYFRPLTRANLKLAHPKHIVLNLLLVESGALCSWINESETQQMGSFEQYSHVKPHPKIKYETIQLLNRTTVPGNIVIQYGYRERKGDRNYYFTAVNAEVTSVSGKEQLFTIVTYDSITVYAERVFYNRNKNMIRAVNAVYDHGGERERFKEIVIKIGKNSSPKFVFKK